MFKKEKKKSAFQKTGNRSFYCTAVSVVLFLCFTAVARGSSVRSLTSTTDRIKAHRLSLFGGISLTSSPARCSPLICSIGASSASSCSAPERPAGGDTGFVRIHYQLLGAGRSLLLVGRMLEQPDVSALPPPPWLKLHV